MRGIPEDVKSVDGDDVLEGGMCTSTGISPQLRRWQSSYGYTNMRAVGATGTQVTPVAKDAIRMGRRELTRQLPTHKM